MNSRKSTNSSTNQTNSTTSKKSNGHSSTKEGSPKTAHQAEETEKEINILAQRATEEKQAHLREVENERQKQILKTHPPTHTNGRKGKG